MDDGPGLADGRHFAGVTTSFVIEYLRSQMPESAIAALLRRAGDTRTVDEVADHSAWSTYTQVRRFLEAAVEELGDGAALRDIGKDLSVDAAVAPEFASSLQALGSPEALYRDLADLSSHFSPVLSVATHEISRTEWICEVRFKEGFEPFRAYCDYQCALLGMVPRVFSFPVAEAVEEACQLDGAPCCRFRVHWDAEDDAQRRADHLQLQLDVSNARLETLHATVRELVGDNGMEHVLERILASTARAVSAPAYVLALDNVPAAARRVYAIGIGEDQARRVSAEILDENHAESPNRLVVDVVSTRRRYGKLGALQRDGGRFYPQERASLNAYARLAAAALDSAAALEEARRQAATAEALLTLSSALAAIVSVDEVAARIVRSVPEIVDCDRAAIVLIDTDTSIGQVAATHGYSEAAEVALRAVHFPGVRVDRTWIADSNTETGAIPDVLQHWSTEHGAARTVACPIISNGQTLGWLSASVETRPERLDDIQRVETRLRGLTGLAATAICNSRLLDEIRHQALHDNLTGLPNRALVLDRLGQLLVRVRRRHTTASVLFLDLDGFKEVNDTLGHAAGDELLRLAAARLEETLRRSDTIGRLGGDEFIVLAEADTAGARPELAAERILAALRAPFIVGTRTVRVTASVGIAVGDREEPGELLRDADIALYQAKADGKDRYVCYAPEMHEAVRDHVQLESDLRSALDREEFFLVYQPICNLENGAPTGVEALLRWMHPGRGVLAPDIFIPTLEANGMILDVGRWVLDTACKQAAAWRTRGFELELSVNVSGRQLEHAAFYDHVRDALATSGLESCALVLEITESVAMDDVELSRDRLTHLKQLGVKIAIDDFGTGYSSLAHLRRFPVDTLKIDRSFVNGVNESSEADALMHMLVTLGKTLGLETVAEGIEIHEQYAHMQREECDRGQGFLIARPLAACDVEEFLARTWSASASIRVGRRP